MMEKEIYEQFDWPIQRLLLQKVNFGVDEC